MAYPHLTTIRLTVNSLAGESRPFFYWTNATQRTPGPGKARAVVLREVRTGRAGNRFPKAS